MKNFIPVSARWDRLVEEALTEAAHFAWSRAGKHDSTWPELTVQQRDRYMEQLRNEFWLAFYERFDLEESPDGIL